MAGIWRVFRSVWELLRELSGENAYARYAATVRARGGEPLTEEGFFRLQLERQYSRPNRCC